MGGRLAETKRQINDSGTEKGELTHSKFYYITHAICGDDWVIMTKNTKEKRGNEMLFIPVPVQYLIKLLHWVNFFVAISEMI